MLRIFLVLAVIFTCISLSTHNGKAMTLGSHFVVGASLAQSLADSEFSAALIGFSSHALLDALPHNDTSSEVLLVTTIGAVVYAYKLIKSENTDWKIALLGGLLGMLPDIEHGLKRKGIISRSYYPSHTGVIRQPRAEPWFAILSVSRLLLLKVRFA